MKQMLLLLLCFVAAPGLSYAAETSRPENVTEDGYTLFAIFNMKGMVGNITFHQMSLEDNVTISVNLDILPSSEEPVPVENFKWAIETFPVVYDAEDLCHRRHLGRSLHNLNDKHGELSLPNNETELQFENTDLKLVGLETIWGRSITLTDSKRTKYCATIMVLHTVKTAKAKLYSPVAGEVIFRENQYGDTTILTNLFTVSHEYQPTVYPWQILISDILDRNEIKGGTDGFCEYLNQVYDIHSTDSTNCSEIEHSKCKVGQLTAKHGGIKVSSSNSRYSKNMFVDTHLPLIDLGELQSTFVVIYENSLDTRIMSCGHIVNMKGRDQIAHFSNEGVVGYVRLVQESPFDPTIVTVNLGGLKDRGSGYHIHEFPRPYQIDPGQQLCSANAVGNHFNPFKVDKSKGPPAGYGTSDQYEVGDLSGKFGNLSGDTVDESFVDFNLPLFGQYSVTGKAIVIHKLSGDRWICANIEHSTDMTTAMATFYYPVIGHVVFRQEKDNPFAETHVFADLRYNDGTRNNTLNHRWGIHTHSPGRDFYDWQNRCRSAANEFNPHRISKENSYQRYCSKDNVLQCSLGDLTMKLGRIAVAVRKGSMQNKFMFTDLNLALTGANNIIGRSVVIFDDKAPTLRGDRLACTIIYQKHPIKVKISRWQTSRSIASHVQGTVTLYQQSPFDSTKIAVAIEGLNEEASGYHIHKWPYISNLYFPCTGDSVSGHFNPFNISARSGPPAGIGSYDKYEVGDLSGKYGLMNGYSSYSFESIDPTLPLHGPNSVMGRSIVIHKQDRNFRWVCGNFEPDLQLGYANKVVAMASFDQLQGYLRGYVRLTQLVYAHGGASDTTVEIKLSYPGKNNRNITTGHKWAVYVNQVGADAEVKSEKSRCIAAGYLWNPYFAQTEDFEAYTRDCNIHNPYRCQMGDLSGRHGVLQVGVYRQVFTDVNLPLYGNASVLGRSIVIHSKAGGRHSLGCANIILERHLVQKVTIKKPQRSGTSGFMDSVRDALGTFDWLVYSEALSETFVRNGQCVELTIHFRGSDAFRLAEEFKNLMSTGEIRKHTRLGVKHKKIPYRLCTQQRSSSFKTSSGMAAKFLAVIYIVFMYTFF